MAVNLSPVGGVAAQFFTNSGVPLTGGKIFTYAAGTTTPQASYTTSQGNVAWTNPIVLDAAGRVPSSGEIWLTDGLIYKFVLKDANDVLIATYDNITGINDIDSENVRYLPPFSNSVLRNVESKLAESVSIEDFGAVGDNITDCTAAIQAALDTGFDVLIPQGTFVVTDSILLTNNNQSIYGTGDASYIKQTVADKQTLGGSGLYGVQLRNFRITPSPGHSVLDNSAVKLTNCVRCVVDGVTVDYNNASAFHGIWLLNSSNNRITNNLFLNAPDTNNVYFTAGGADISVTELSSYNIISNNRCISGNVYGINITTNTNGNTVGNEITGNTVRDCTAYGIILYGGDPNKYLGDSIIANNVIDNITAGALTVVSPPEKWFGSGIYLNGVLNSIISNNQISDVALQNNAGSLPIGGISGTQNANIVTGNKISNSGQYGIYFSAGNATSTFPEPLGVSMIVSDNLISDPTQAGIKLYNGRRVTVNNNYIYSGNALGIEIDTNDDWRTHVKVTGNTVANTTAGIRVNRAIDCLINDNTVKNATSTGMSVENTAFATIKSNDFVDLSVNGCVIDATVADGIFRDNYFKNIGNYAAIMAGNLQVSGNVFDNVTAGNWLGAYPGGFRTLDNTGTPSVKNGSIFFTGGTTSITNFLGGLPGDIIVVHAVHVVTLTNGANINLKGGVNFNMVGGNIITLQRYNTTTWVEVSRNV